LTGRPTERSQFKDCEVSFIYPFLNVHHRCVCVCVCVCVMLQQQPPNSFLLGYSLLSDTRTTLNAVSARKKKRQHRSNAAAFTSKNSNVTVYSILKFALKNTGFIQLTQNSARHAAAARLHALALLRTSFFARNVY